MVVNRYTRVTPSRFNPLSMKEIFAVPLAKQRQHDENIALADELGLFDLNRLQADDEEARKYIDSYGKNIDKTVDDIYSKGITNEARRNLRKLAKEKQNWMSQDGVGGKMQANYQAYANYKANLDEAVKEGKLGTDRYNRLLNQALAEYTGVVNDGKLNLEDAAARVDIAKKLQPYMKDIMSNPDLLEQNTGFKFDENSGMFINVKNGRKSTQEGLVGIVANNLAKLDPEVMQYLNQRERLGLGSAEETIAGLAQTFNAGYSVNETTQDITGKYPPEWTGGGPNNDNNGRGTFELTGARELNLKNRMLRNELNSILSGTSKINKVGMTASSSLGATVSTGDTFTVTTYENLSDEQKTKFNTILDGLKNSGEFESGNTDINISIEDLKKDPDLKKQYEDDRKKEIQAVKKYLDDHQDLDYQNILNTKDMYKTYSDRSTRIKKSTPVELAEAIKVNGAYRVWIDSKTGEEVKFEDLDQEQIQKGKVAGVYDAKNYLSKSIDDPIHSNSLVSPYEFVTPDGKRYLVSRDQSEQQTGEYQADAKFQDTWQTITMMPDIPHKINIPEFGGDVYITKKGDKIYINTADPETNEITTNSKRYTLDNDDELRALYQELYNNN
jgi:Fe-S cluster biosynthesis and repair protein YggX